MKPALLLRLEQTPPTKQSTCVKTQAQALRLRKQAIHMMNELKKYFPENSPIVQCTVNIYNNANLLVDYMKSHK